ncbi:MAG: S8 family peptidase, partial [Dysosmobacter sp.]|nr:S8 family peptidase [Dysosmobacter sp.]
RYCVPADQEHAYESSAVMVGVEYVLRRARELGRPVVICIGLGTNAGSHDGASVFEEYLGGVSLQAGVCLCAAAGNEAEARHHTGGVLQPGEKPGTVDLKVGENAGNVYVAVWNTVADRLSVSVRSPSGELVGRVPARPGIGPAADVKLVLEAARVQIEYHFPVERSGGQLTVIRILGATPGVWTIQLHGDILLNGSYQVWLPMTGFVSPSVEFLAATPDCTVTSPASAVGVICCGAYDSNNKSLYAKSSRGPAWDGRVLPDLTAPGVGVRGIYPYGPGLMSGTSAAAAVLAGTCALLLQWGVREGNDPAMGTYQIRAYLIRGCLRRPDMQYPNNQWGYGSVQLMQTFHLMREL